MPWTVINGEWVEVDYLPSEVPPQDNAEWVNAGSHTTLNYGYWLKRIIIIGVTIAVIRNATK